MKLYQQANYSHVKAPATSVSDKYNFQNSDNIINLVQDKFGLQHTGTSWAGIRKNKQQRGGQQRHLMSFSYAGAGDSLQLLIQNGHEGRTAIKVDLGYFRAACANGIVVGESIFSDRMIHKGSTRPLADIIDSALTAGGLMRERIEQLKSVQADNLMYCALYRSLSRLRGNLDIAHESIRVQREEDAGKDLWTKFNMFQEYAIRGGFQYRKAKPGVEVNASGYIANPSRRQDYQLRTGMAINGIEDAMRINKGLWEDTLALI